MSISTRIHQAFGLHLQCSFPLPELPVCAGDGRVDVEISAETADVVAAAFSGSADPRAVRTGLLGDGCWQRTERGRAGDIRIEYDRRAAFHITADAREIRCWAAEPAALAWRRFLLDTVLGTAALEHGYEALHAAAFERGGAAIAVVAKQGGGKSTLLAELVRRGRPLFSDDVLVLARRSGLSIAHPGPALMNLTPKLSNGAPAAHVGRVLGVVDGESWVAIDRASTQARPLGAVVFLARRGHQPIAVHRVPPNPAALLSHSLPSGREPARLDKRFALFAEIAARVPLLRLRVPVHVSAAKVADALEAILERTRARGSAA